MFKFLSMFFSKDVVRISCLRAKRLQCVFGLVDNPANLNFESSSFIVPDITDLELCLKAYRPPKYGPGMRCIHIARNLAAYLDGRQWAIGLVRVKTTQDKHNHALVSCIVRNKQGMPFVVYIDAETKEYHPENFKLIYGTVA